MNRMSEIFASSKSSVECDPTRQPKFRDRNSASSVLRGVILCRSKLACSLRFRGVEGVQVHLVEQGTRSGYLEVLVTVNILPAEVTSAEGSVIDLICLCESTHH